MFKINKLPTNIPGLKYQPSLVDYDNNVEFIEDYFLKIARKTEPRDYFSARNSYLLFEYIELLKLNTEKSGTILEIGIGKKDRYKFTSTATILKTKHKCVRYIGIDVESREWLLGKRDNIFLYHDLSANVFEKIIKKKFIDLLHIDGNHSINGTIIDWQFSQLVKDIGVILLHDIKSHPGPITLIDAIDTDIYTVHKLFLDDEKDFGMAVVYKKENDYGRIIN